MPKTASATTGFWSLSGSVGGAPCAQESPRFRMNDDREVRCYALATDAFISKPETPAELKRLWYAFRDVEDGCTYTA